MSKLTMRSAGARLGVFVPAVSSQVIYELLSFPFYYGSSQGLTESGPSQLGVTFITSVVPAAYDFDPFSDVDFSY